MSPSNRFDFILKQLTLECYRFFNPLPTTVLTALFPIYPSSHGMCACNRQISVKNLISKIKHYQVRVQGHVQKRTEKTKSGEGVFHNHDSKSLVTWARIKGLKMGTWSLHSQKLHFRESGHHANSHLEFLS